jgi:hypothetical protein
MDDTQLIGMEKQAAIDLCKTNGVAVRVRSEDGEAFIGTADLRMDRINIHVNKGKVTSASRG